MEFPRAVRVFLRAGAALTMVFLYTPLLIVFIYAFNKTRVQRWPPSGLTLSWFDKASHNSGALDALWVSIQVAIGATLIALVLGSLAALALSRLEFFGKAGLSSRDSASAASEPSTSAIRVAPIATWMLTHSASSAPLLCDALSNQ